MSHEKWDEKNIEELLSSAPKIKDTRSKDDILQRLKDDGLFDEEPSETSKVIKKKKFNWLPPIISVAALVLLAIMVPSLMKQVNNGGSEESAAKITNSDDAAAEINMFSNSIDSRMSETEMSISSDIGSSTKTAVYPEDTEGYTIFRLGLASDAADSVPVTILIPNEQVMEDLGKPNPTEVELYNYYAPLFDESAVGFADFHPYVGVISEQGNQVIHTLPEGHPYDIASATIAAYEASILDTFPSYEEAVFLNEDGNPITFDQEGVPRQPLDLHGEKSKNSYFLHVQSDGTEYLVPNFRNAETYSTVEEALESMKVEINDIYKSVILPDVDYTISVEGETVTVEFVSQVDLLNYDQVDAMQMIEGILLTAASFDMSVQFENVVQTDWNGFNFTNPLPIPVGANKLPFIYPIKDM
nr:hypothetical protein [Lysinibacillus timonensis]